MAKKLGGRPGGLSGEPSGVRPGADEEAEVETLPSESDDVYEHIESLKERFGEGEQGRVQVMRRLPDGTLVSLPSLPALTFDVDVVAAKYGGGRYEFKFYKGKQFLGRDSFTIDPTIKPAPEPPPEAARPVGGSGDGMPTWLAASLDKMGDAIKALAERKPEPPPTPPDPMAMIRAIGETMKALTPAPPPAPKELPAPPSFKEQLETIKSVIEVGTSIVEARGEGGGGSGDAYMGVVSKLADPVIELVKTQAARERLRGPRRPALLPPAAGPVPDQPAAPAPAGGVQMPWLLEVQRWLPLIQKRQQKGLSAESTAFFVLDELSDNTLAALAELAAQDGFEDQVKKLLPAEMLQAPEWVNEFLVAVKDYLFEDADAQPEGEGVIDLAEEAERRIGALKDKEEGPEQEQEPAP